jgi:hypothetical protein
MINEMHVQIIILYSFDLIFFFHNFFITRHFYAFYLFLLNVVCNFVHGSKHTQRSHKYYSYYDHKSFFPQNDFSIQMNF